MYNSINLQGLFQYYQRQREKSRSPSMVEQPLSGESFFLFLTAENNDLRQQLQQANHRVVELQKDLVLLSLQSQDKKQDRKLKSFSNHIVLNRVMYSSEDKQTPSVQMCLPLLEMLTNQQVEIQNLQASLKHITEEKEKLLRELDRSRQQFSFDAKLLKQDILNLLNENSILKGKLSDQNSQVSIHQKLDQTLYKQELILSRLKKLKCPQIQDTQTKSIQYFPKDLSISQIDLQKSQFSASLNRNQSVVEKKDSWIENQFKKMVLQKRISSERMNRNGNQGDMSNLEMKIENACYETASQLKRELRRKNLLGKSENS